MDLVSCCSVLLTARSLFYLCRFQMIQSYVPESLVPLSPSSGGGRVEPGPLNPWPFFSKSSKNTHSELCSPGADFHFFALTQIIDLRLNPWTHWEHHFGFMEDSGQCRSAVWSQANSYNSKDSRTHLHWTRKQKLGECHCSQTLCLDVGLGGGLRNFFTPLLSKDQTVSIFQIWVGYENECEHALAASSPRKALQKTALPIAVLFFKTDGFHVAQKSSVFSRCLNPEKHQLLFFYLHCCFNWHNASSLSGIFRINLIQNHAQFKQNQNIFVSKMAKKPGMHNSKTASGIGRQTNRIY